MNFSKITGTGSYIPTLKKENSNFIDTHFLNPDGTDFSNGNQVIIEKFKMITGIEERRYAAPHFNTSDLGFFAATKAIEDAKIDAEELDLSGCINLKNLSCSSNELINLDLSPCPLIEWVGANSNDLLNINLLN